MITFLGALMISGTPRLFKPVTGTLMGWACQYGESKGGSELPLDGPCKQQFTTSLVPFYLSTTDIRILTRTCRDPIHRDAAIYPDPNRFGPFRFAQPGAGRSSSPHVGLEKSSVTLDNTFLGFGFGKHACPDRFFALHEIKIFVAHMVLNYDVEYLGERPELTNMVWLNVPYDQGRVRVRRRQVGG
jgi:hypothetical protein